MHICAHLAFRQRVNSLSSALFHCRVAFGDDITIEASQSNVKKANASKPHHDREQAPPTLV